jgi:hypothetical protein
MIELENVRSPAPALKENIINLRRSPYTPKNQAEPPPVHPSSAMIGLGNHTNVRKNLSLFRSLGPIIFEGLVWELCPSLFGNTGITDSPYGNFAPLPA